MLAATVAEKVHMAKEEEGMLLAKVDKPVAGRMWATVVKEVSSNNNIHTHIFRKWMLLAEADKPVAGRRGMAQAKEAYTNHTHHTDINTPTTFMEGMPEAKVAKEGMQPAKVGMPVAGHRCQHRSWCNLRGEPSFAGPCRTPKACWTRPPR